MKDKIKEIAYQVKLLDDDGWNTSNLTRDVEKFAELIIQECISQCLSATETEHYGTIDGFIVDECAKRIRNRFDLK
jgi:uncharacterized protein YutE (UPF0331/DUF86 family)